MKRALIALGVAFGLLVLGSGSVLADAMPTPGGGPAFGQHVEAMSPGVGGTMMGADFGVCVSAMASTSICPCAIAEPGS
ncbi:MAG TPA: hypothetical protein VFL27_13410 [Candidatus Dormibacteraeota bacterium]|nr:hypothetical protein [Candidatus Dormibacteraeota bacterium]